MPGVCHNLNDMGALDGDDIDDMLVSNLFICLFALEKYCRLISESLREETGEGRGEQEGEKEEKRGKESACMSGEFSYLGRGSLAGRADKTVRQVGTGTCSLTSYLMIQQPCLSCGLYLQPQFLDVSC